MITQYQSTYITKALSRHAAQCEEFEIDNVANEAALVAMVSMHNQGWTLSEMEQAFPSLNDDTIACFMHVLTY